MSIKMNEIEQSSTFKITDSQLLNTDTPGSLHVIRRDGKLVRYDYDRITVAMKKAFIAVEGDTAASSDRIHNMVNELTSSITERLERRWPAGGTIHIEAIQDQVELALILD